MKAGFSSSLFGHFGCQERKRIQDPGSGLCQFETARQLNRAAGWPVISDHRVLYNIFVFLSIDPNGNVIVNSLGVFLAAAIFALSQAYVRRCPRFSGCMAAITLMCSGRNHDVDPDI
jgi:hypothetical protein